MKRAVCLMAMIFLLGWSLTALADGHPAALGKGMINGMDADRVHLREEPRQSAQSLGLLFTGAEVDYYSDPSEEWVQVALPGAQYGMLGYVKSEYLYVGDPALMVPRARQAKVVGIAENSWVNMREDISQRVRVLRQLRLGELVTVWGELAVDGGWSLVQADGEKGYVVSQYLQYVDAVYLDGRDADRVHLRQSASQAAPSLGLYFTGTQASCLSDPGEEWVRVQIGAVTGYVMGKYLTEDAVEPRQPVATVAHIENDSLLNLYQVPQERAQSGGEAPYGAKVTVLGETADGWCYVQYGDMRGYARAQYLSVDQ